jgi:hypothetical protein
VRHADEDSDPLTPEQRWSELITAVDASDDPDGLRELGHSLLQFWELADWQPRLGDQARRDPKVATALESALLLRGRILADIVGWDHITTTWCRFYDLQDRWDQWAEQMLIPLLQDRQALPAHEAWQVVLSLLEAAPNEKVLGNIGAGPIEDLLSSDPERVAQLIESEANNNPRLRRALAHVWQHRTPEDVFERVKRLAEPANGH